MIILQLCNLSILAGTIWLAVSHYTEPSHQQLVYVIRGLASLISLMPIGPWQLQLIVLCTWFLFCIQSVVFILQQVGLFMQDSPVESVIYVSLFAALVLNGIVERIKKNIQEGNVASPV